MALAAGLLLLAAAAGESRAQGQGPAAVHVDPVRAVPVAQTAPVIGRLVATRAGDVAARVAAPVADYLVEVGDTVDRGQTLVLLDDAVLAARRNQATAALAEARARLDTRRQQLALAQQALTRLERLQGSAAFSRARFDDQRLEVAIAQAEVGSARAAIGRAEADLARARIEAERTQVTAPYAGVVVRRHLEAGAYAQAGAPLLRLVSDRALEVEADVPAARLAGLEAGLRVEVELAPEDRRSASVRAVLPEESPQTRTRRVRFVPGFETAGARFASGQSVTLHLPLGPGRDVLSVHKDAVIRQGEQATVYVFENGQAQVRPVELGAEVGARFEVLDGLQAGQLAVVRGNERLRPGQALTIDKRLGPGDQQAAGVPDGS